MNRENVLKLLSDIRCESDNPLYYFDQSMNIFRMLGIEKGIEIEEYYQTKFLKEAKKHPVFFDDEYFQNKDRRNLYVYHCALLDTEIFSYLNLFWSYHSGEELNENVLHREIFFLEEKGIRF